MTRQFEPLEPNDFLVVIDVQNDFCPGGAFGIPGGDAVIPVLNIVGKKFRHVVITQDWHPADHISFASNHPDARPWDLVATPHGPQFVFVDHCVQNSDGAALHPALDLPHAEAVIRKGHQSAIDSNSAFLGNDGTTPTGLNGYLTDRGCKRVFLAGLALDGCVFKSAEHALELGYDVFVITDASMAVDIDGSKEIAVRTMREKGVVLIESTKVVAARAEAAAVSSAIGNPATGRSDGVFLAPFAKHDTTS